MKIIVSGSIAFDIILDFPGKFSDHIDVEKIHSLSVSFLVDKVQKSIGGTAANIAYNLVSLGLKPELVGNVGTDGREILRRLSRMGAGTSGVRISKKFGTSTAFVMTDRVDNQISAFYVGAMREKVLFPKVTPKDWPIIAAADPKNMTALAKFYQKYHLRYIYDPGQQITALSSSQLREGVKGASIIVGNDYEISQLLKKLGRVKPSAIIFKTLGPRGSEIIYPNRRTVKVRAIASTRVVDPTGAGDAYRAGLIKGIVEGLDLERAAQLASTAAVFAVECYGTQNHKINYDIIRRRHNKNYKKKI